MGRLDGRTAVVTGAAHGDRAALGVVYAKALAAEGAKVVVADVKDTSDVAEEIIAGGDALALGVDVTDEAQVNDLIAKKSIIMAVWKFSLTMRPLALTSHKSL